jgi:hypothetical protein
MSHWFKEFKIIVVMLIMVICFFLGSAVAAPMLIEPEYGENVPYTTIDFWWTSEGDVLYRYQLWTDLQGSVIDGWFAPNWSDYYELYWLRVTGLPNNGQVYKWRVGPSDGYFSDWSEFTNGPSAPPAVPALVYPVNGSNVSGSSITFDWSKADRTFTYYLALATDSTFTQNYYLSDPVIWHYGTAFTVTGLPNNGETLYWIVEAWNPYNGGSYTFSSVNGFVNAPSGPPDKPILTAPANGAHVSDTDITFSWNSALRAYMYYVEVATNSTFTANFQIYPVAYDYETAINMPDFPDNDETFYWRVRAYNSYDRGSNSYSQTFSFVNSASAIPEVPQLVAPADGAYISGDFMIFQWGPSARTATYYFQIATNSAFTANFQEYDVPYNEDTIVSMVNFPDNGDTYYWRVKAHNSRGNTFSSTYSVVNYPSELPDTPVLKTPAASSVVPGSPVLFEWEETARASDYYLEVATDPEFSNKKFGNWIGNNLSKNVSLSNTGLEYFWRVGAGNTLGEGLFSDARRFFNGIAAEGCSPSIGTGQGRFYLWDHLDICYDQSYYWLEDKSRRAGMNIHGHNGAMKVDSSIKTFDGGYLAKDGGRVFNAAAQMSAVDGHAHAGMIYDYLKDANKGWYLNSYDNIGNSMLTYVNDSSCPDNGFWEDDSKRVCIGPNIRFSSAIDFTGHEWGHSVMFNSASKHNYLDYFEEQAAIVEAFADWMGVSVEHYYYGTNNWTIGETLNFVVRDLSNPPAKGHPDYRSDGTIIDPNWHDPTGCFNPDRATNDLCWAHKNAGVLNKMFYLLSEGDTHAKSNISVQGIGIQKAMDIAFKANKEFWDSTEEILNFDSALLGLVDAAKKYYGGIASNETCQVLNAGAAVGIGTLPKINLAASPSGGGTVTGGGYYEWGSSATVAATPNPAYNFLNWTVGTTVVSSDATYSFVVSGIKTLTANFVLKPQNISIEPASNDFGTVYIGDASAPRTFVVTNRGSLPLSISTVSKGGKTPYQFRIVEDNCSGVVLNANETCTIQVSLVPTFEGAITASLLISSNDPDTPVFNVLLNGIGSYITISAASNVGGSITPGTVSLVYGDSQTFTIAASAGYHILDVKVDGISQGALTAYLFMDVTEDHTIEAVFENNNATFTVTATSGANGTISPLSAIVGWNKTKSFTVIPNTGYHIATVTGCGGTLTGSLYKTGPVTANCAVKATFAINKYDLTVTKTGEGTGTVTSTDSKINCGSACTAAYNYNSSVTLSALADSEYVFSGWAGGGCSGAGTCSVTITNGTIVTANFQCRPEPVRINRAVPVYYTTLQAAYNAAAEGEVIQIKAVTLTESPIFGRNINVTIDGGYDCHFKALAGRTAIKGNAAFSAGKVKLGDISFLK